MQIYGLKLYNLFRFGDTNNTVVFDINEEDKESLANHSLTIDELYEKLKADPVKYIKMVKQQGITGLIAISGILDNNKSRSNGAGKSSIMEGICYANYDRIVRKNLNPNSIERAGLSVVPKFNGQYPSDLRESYVEQIFEERGKVYRLKRGRTFTKNQKSHSPLVEFECINADSKDSQAGHRTGDTNQAIADVVNMDYDVFINSVMFGQNDAGKFLTGTDKTKKEMLISLLRLQEVVSSCLERVRKRKNSKDKEISGFKAQAEIIEESTDFDDDINNLNENLQRKGTEATILLSSIAKNEDSIKELSQSKEVSRLNDVKTRGKTVQDDLKVKQEDQDSQTKAWKDLFAKAVAGIASVTKKIKTTTTHADKLSKSKTDLSESVDNFDLDYHKTIIEKAEKAKSLLPKYNDFLVSSQPQHDKLIADISKLNTKIGIADEEYTPLQRQFDEVGEKQEFTCRECKSIVTREHIENLIAENRTLRDDLREKVMVCNTVLGKLKTKVDEANQRISKCNEMIASGKDAEFNIKNHESNNKRLGEIDDEVVASQTTIVELKAEGNLLTKQREEHKEKLETIAKQFDSDITRLSSELEKLKGQLKDASEKSGKIQSRMHMMKEENNQKRESHSRCMATIGSMRKEISTITENKIKLKEVNDLKKEAEEELNRLLVLEDVFGLEGIQTSIVKKYLPLLNVYIRESLNILSDGEMIVKLFVNEKLHIDMSIRGGAAGSYEMLSGGEKVVVRLAVDIAMAQLSFSRSSQKPEIICLDEIFSNLDDLHTSTVFKLISHLREKFSRVLVISHEQEVNDLIENQIVIRRGVGDFARSSVAKII